MPVARVKLPDGRIARFEVPDGTTPEQVQAFAQKQFGGGGGQGQEKPQKIDATPDELFGAIQRTDVSNRIANGAGDVALGAGQLLANLAKPITEAPANWINNYITDRNKRIDRDRTIVAQALGKDKPGLDISRGIGSGITTMALMPQKAAAKTLLGRAGQSALLGGGGALMQPVDVKDDNYSIEKLKQVGIGAALGFVAAPVAEILIRGVGASARAISSFGARSIGQDQIDDTLSAALKENGINWASLSDDVKGALRVDVKKALVAGGDLDDKALARLADIRSVGATPTRGTVTLDPAQLTREKNLAKIGANSADDQLRRLSQVENENAGALIERLNQLGARGSGDEFATGRQLIDALRADDAKSANAVSLLFKQAEAKNAGAISMDGAAFVDKATKALDASRRGSFLPTEVRSIMTDVMSRAKRGIPMTLDDAEQLRTILATAQRSSKDGNARHAIKVVRDALENTPTASSLGDDATRAFATARNAHRLRMAAQEDSPALAAAVEGAEPDQFFKKYIVGGGATVKDLNALRRSVEKVPEAMDSTRAQIVNFLKSKAIGSNPEESRVFSQAAFNRALDSIGDRKLSVFFNPEEIAQIRQVGRAANYLQVQPRGSAVNNSNTASALFGALDRMVSRVPFGDVAVRSPVNNLLQQRQITNALNSLLPVTSSASRFPLNALSITPALGGSLGVVVAQE